MSDIDKWFADKCEVNVFGDRCRVIDNNYPMIIYWDIKLANCREMIREKFKIETFYGYAEKNWFCEGERKADKGRGKTIEDAEIATCKAIYEARDD